jgi:hypothetical protein
MGYFDSLIDFKSTPDGEIIYYPYRFWGKGYIVPSLEKKEEIQNAAKRIHKIFFLFVFVGIIGLGVSITLLSDRWWWVLSGFTFLILTGLAIWCQRALKALAQGLVQSSVKISLLESYTHSALSLSFVTLVVFELITWYMVFTGSQIASNPQYYPWLFRPLGIFAVIFSGFGSIAFLYMLIVKIKIALRK